jgi:hypothetical protein
VPLRRLQPKGVVSLWRVNSSAQSRSTRETEGTNCYLALVGKKAMDLGLSSQGERIPFDRPLTVAVEAWEGHHKLTKLLFEVVGELIRIVSFLHRTGFASNVLEQRLEMMLA